MVFLYKVKLSTLKKYLPRIAQLGDKIGLVNTRISLLLSDFLF